jgi:hypothetical protein
MRGHHTEEVTTGIFHNPPGLYGRFPTRSEFLQPLDFRLDIIGFDVQMHAAGVMHPLESEIQPPSPGGACTAFGTWFHQSSIRAEGAAPGGC